LDFSGFLGLKKTSKNLGFFTTPLDSPDLMALRQHMWRLVGCVNYYNHQRIKSPILPK